MVISRGFSPRNVDGFGRVRRVQQEGIFQIDCRFWLNLNFRFGSFLTKTLLSFFLFLYDIFFEEFSLLFFSYSREQVFLTEA